MVQQKLYFSGMKLSCMSQQTIISSSSDTILYVCVCVCARARVCVRVRARARARVCVCARVCARAISKPEVSVLPHHHRPIYETLEKKC